MVVAIVVVLLVVDKVVQEEVIVGLMIVSNRNTNSLYGTTIEVATLYLTVREHII